MTNTLANRGQTAPTYSIPSIIAIAAAIGSFVVGPGLGLVLAIVAIIFGVIGVLVALLPNVRGGIISTISVLAGVIGIVGAVLRIIF